MVADKPLVPWEQAITAGLPASRTRLFELSYQLARQLASHNDHMFYIADVFDKTTEEIFIDNVHVTPEGNALVADAMFQAIGWGDDGNPSTQLTPRHSTRELASKE